MRQRNAKARSGGSGGGKWRQIRDLVLDSGGTRDGNDDDDDYAASDTLGATDSKVSFLQTQCVREKSRPPRYMLTVSLHAIRN